MALPRHGRPAKKLGVKHELVLPDSFWECLSVDGEHAEAFVQICEKFDVAAWQAASVPQGYANEAALNSCL